MLLKPCGKQLNPAIAMEYLIGLLETSETDAMSALKRKFSQLNDIDLRNCQTIAMILFLNADTNIDTKSQTTPNFRETHHWEIHYECT